ncbi:formimidoylglutamate deiminase [Paraburkholderia hospita]|jgi:formimidoylglutamate deiminase|uniref:formimidoylglutamate deiminase n=1 Tax=Paraburkholderia hospita TaxID=169430 RepID=UPI0009A5C8E9|nr:formimidoylglutamate deiminase [Paraburkholderia hospita]OUL70179.1 formimidoylglutamate deiminase [Paraburkholderia hospita]SKC68439.1 formimidoylglutamate deiminase [Paraburkholderia hospita]SOE67339.1 formimidoylglutamate deiminase [Burkholderia sp. YR290]
MTQATQSLFADHAYLPEGWRRDVLLQWDAQGALVSVTPDAQAPAGVAKASGPVLPGMPNLHSHAFQRAMAGLTEYRANATDNFWSWRDLMYRFAARITPEGLASIAQWLYIEMLKAGYTSVCEFHYVHHMQDGKRYANDAELAQRVVDAAGTSGIGITMLPVLYQYAGFGAQPPRDDQRRFINTPDSLLGLLDTLRRARPEHGALRYGVAPHSLRAVSNDSLRELLNGLDAMSPGAPVHIHIAEQTAEVDACVATEGARPVQWLLDRFDVDARWCLVHATHVDAEETAALAKSGAIAGLCLTTEANLGDGIFPAHDYLEQKGRIGVGSDSHIGVDWRSELRLLEYGQRLSRRQRNVLASADMPRVADRLFAASLEGGALATGRAVGALRTGARADFIVLDADHASIAEHANDAWLAGVVFCEHGETPIRDVYAGGAKVVDNRRHRDEEHAYAQYRAALAELLK